MSLLHISDEILTGTGNPEASQAGTLGQLYLQTDTGQTFQKKTTTTNTSWQSLDGSVVQNSTPSTGNTINIALQTDILNLTPAGTLTALTVNLYNTASDLWIGKRVITTTSQIITTLTLAASGMTIRNGITTLGAGGFATYQYIATNTWARIS